MFHSSFVPIALPSSLLLAVVMYYFLCLFIPPRDAISITLWGAGFANVLIGVPKNIMLGDFLSLVIVRPLSLVLTIVFLWIGYNTVHVQMT